MRRRFMVGTLAAVLVAAGLATANSADGHAAPPLAGVDSTLGKGPVRAVAPLSGYSGAMPPGGAPSGSAVQPTAAPTSPPVAGGGTVTGLVTDAAGAHRPLAGVRVTVGSATARQSRSVTTRPDGRYVVAGLASAADYTVCFVGSSATGGSSDAFGYVPGCYLNQAAQGTLRVTQGQTTSGVDATLSRGGVISGMVRDAASHRALSGVTVRVSRRYGPATDRDNGTARTRADGSYAVTGLPAGVLSDGSAYKVCFDPSDADESGAPAYGAQCYDRQPTWEGSTALDVLPGSVRGGVDASLVAGGAVTGIVTDGSATHRPLRGAVITVYGLEFVARARAMTGADGSYRLESLAPGAYWLLVEGADAVGGSTDAQGYVGLAYAEGPHVTVTARTTTSHVDIALSPGGAITALVRDAAGSRSPLANVSLPAWTFGTSYGSAQPSTATNGRVTVKGLPPRTDYQVCFSPGRSVTGGSFDALGYLAACANGDSPDQPGTVVVAAGATTHLEVGLDHGGAVAGVVKEASSQQPLANVSVQLQQANGNQLSSVTGSDGRYRILGALPGSGSVCFVPGAAAVGGSNAALGYLPECYDNVTGGATPTPVSVAVGKTTAVSGGLKPAGGVAGTVRDSGGGHRGLDRVRVYVQSTSTNTFAVTDTQSDGTYLVTGLPPASDYLVCFAAERATGGSTDSIGYVNECYDDFPFADTGTPVVVTARRVHADVDASLSPAGAVRGVVRDAGGTHHPLSGVLVVAFSKRELGSPRVATTDADGTYRIPGLPPDTDYSVCFSYGLSATGGSNDPYGYTDECYDDKPEGSPFTRVRVVNGSATTVSAALSPAMGVAGQVRQGSTGRPLENVVVRAASASLGASGSAVTGLDGSYVMRYLAPAKDWTVCFDASRARGGDDDTRGYVDECWRNKPGGAAPTPVVVTAKGVTPGVSAALAPKPSS